MALSNARPDADPILADVSYDDANVHHRRRRHRHDVHLLLRRRLLLHLHLWDSVALRALAVEYCVVQHRADLDDVAVRKEKITGLQGICLVVFAIAYHSAQRVHGCTQCFADASSTSLLRVRAGRVHGTALDEGAHDDNEANADEHHQIPIASDPLGHREQCLAIE